MLRPLKLMRCAGCLLILGLCLDDSYSQVPSTINFQGVLLDETGDPRPDGPYELTVYLYDAESGGPSVWSEKRTVDLIGGIFSFQLGAEVALEIPFDKPYWLSTSVDDAPEVERIALSSVPYSFRSTSVPASGVGTLGGLDGQVLTIAGGIASWQDLGGGGGGGTGDITSVAAGEGLTGGAVAGDATLSLDTGFTDDRYVSQDAANAITSGMIADDVVETNEIKNGSVTSNKISGSGGTNGQILTISGGLPGWADAPAAGGAGDITGVTAGSGLTGGGPTGVVTLLLDTGFTDDRYVEEGELNSVTVGMVAEGVVGKNQMTSAGATVGHVLTAGAGGAVDWKDIASGGNGAGASGEFATVAGGESNEASGGHTSIGGGRFNRAEGDKSTVGGGEGNRADWELSTISGGLNNEIFSRASTIGGGIANNVDGVNSTIGGGANNSVGGDHATVPGGHRNDAAGDFSFAAGRRAASNHSGTFVWADGTDAKFESTASNQFLVRADRVGLGTNSPSNKLSVDGSADVSGSLAVGKSSPGVTLDVQGGNFNLNATEGDFRIGNDSHRLKIGVAVGGAGAGRSFIRSVGLFSEIRLGADDIDIVLLNKNEGFSPVGDNTHSLGTSTRRWTEVWAADGTINTSDRRLKHNIEKLGYGLDEVMDLRPVSFEWNDRQTGQRHLGLIAQEAELVIPEVVKPPTNSEGNYGLRYGDLVPVLIKAIQDQQQIIIEQNGRIGVLEEQIATFLGSN
jgi:hypothetical protein